jgi:Cysteine-rich domain
VSDLRYDLNGTNLPERAQPARATSKTKGNDGGARLKLFTASTRVKWQMRIGLFVTCFIDAFFPEVGIATLELLERFGHKVIYPRDQTCCGQPMAKRVQRRLRGHGSAVRAQFCGFEYVVAGSCVHHVRANFDAVEQTPQVKEVRARTYEIVECLQRTRFRGPDFRTESDYTTAAARCVRSNRRSSMSLSTRIHWNSCPKSRAWRINDGIFAVGENETASPGQVPEAGVSGFMS